MEDQKRARLVIISAFAIFAIVPLLIGIIVVVVQMSSRVSEKDALNTSVSNEMVTAVTEQNEIDPDRVVMHGIASSGDWGALGVFSKEANNFGEATIVILHKEDGGYKSVAMGSSFDDQELLDLDVPNDLVRKLREAEKTAEYTSVLYRSEYNPHNKYSLVQKLPYKSDDLRISYYFKDDYVDDEGVSIPIITIRGVDAAERRRAFDIIREYGYDLGSYKIEFINFNNRFVEEEVIEMTGEDDEP